VVAFIPVLRGDPGIQISKAQNPEPAPDRAKHESRGTANSYDFARLERAIRVLARRKQELERENESLRSELQGHGNRIRMLDERLLEVNQRRQDAIKLVDDLIAQMEQLEASFASRDE
jgi:predicted RNase H-like nuclease (RuvC/YqgF family)